MHYWPRHDFDYAAVLQLITTPFWPAYLTPERIAKAPKLKLALTAGIGMDAWFLQCYSPMTRCSLYLLARDYARSDLPFLRHFVMWRKRLKCALLDLTGTLHLG